MGVVSLLAICGVLLANGTYEVHGTKCFAGVTVIRDLSLQECEAAKNQFTKGEMTMCMVMPSEPLVLNGN